MTCAEVKLGLERGAHLDIWLRLANAHHPEMRRGYWATLLIESMFDEALTGPKIISSRLQQSLIQDVFDHITMRTTKEYLAGT